MDSIKYTDLMWPAIKAILDLGGSANNDEILRQVISNGKFSDATQNTLHNDGPQTELGYQLAWAKSYLKKAGALENSSGRGVWSLTEFGRTLSKDNVQDALKKARVLFADDGKKRKAIKSKEPIADSEDFPEEAEPWKQNLLTHLKSKVSPKAFERLAQRVLRESGFVEVTVTGRAGDGGIDGYGILKMGLLSFKVLFQCKRYKNSVGPSEIRDFHGAMQGRADKGIFITTGTFTNGAKTEAQRDGAPPVDLVDGEELCEILKNLKLGVKTEVIEKCSIDESWFDKI